MDPSLDRGQRLLEGDAPEEVVFAYHERTKHHFDRYAASAGMMDWATQPNPFRRYAGAELVRLPLPQDPGRAVPFWQLYVAGSVAPAPLSIASVSQFFRYALSLTAWKRLRGTTWSLRANPGLRPPQDLAEPLPLHGGWPGGGRAAHDVARIRSRRARRYSLAGDLTVRGTARARGPRPRGAGTASAS